MEIDKRKLSFSLATKACEVLAVNVTAEKLWSLVEVFEPIIESGLTPRAVDKSGRSLRPNRYRQISWSARLVASTKSRSCH